MVTDDPKIRFSGRTPIPAPRIQFDSVALLSSSSSHIDRGIRRTSELTTPNMLDGLRVNRPNDLQVPK